MRVNKNVEMSQSQERKVSWLLSHITDDCPAAEVKSVSVFQPDPEEAPRKVSRLVMVRAEVGFPQDEKDYRKALRVQRLFLVSPRGRIEEWDPKRGFGAVA